MDTSSSIRHHLVVLYTIGHVPVCFVGISLYMHMPCVLCMDVQTSADCSDRNNEMRLIEFFACESTVHALD